MGTRHLYLAVVATYWWAFMMAGPLIADECIKWVWPLARIWLEEKLPSAKRRHLEIAAMVFGVFLAGFLAFKDEHIARQKAEGERDEARRQLVATPVQARHLSNEERVSLITSLRSAGSTNQSIEINTACDECEEYADELRDAIGKVTGWSATGGTLIFSSAAIRGVRFYVRSLDNRAQAAIAWGAALDAAHLHFKWIEDASLPQGYEYRIAVFRQVR